MPLLYTEIIEKKKKTEVKRIVVKLKFTKKTPPAVQNDRC